MEVLGGGGGASLREGRGRRIRRKKGEPAPTLRRQQRILIRASLESSEQRLNCRFCLFEQRAPFKHTGCFLKIPQAARKPRRDVGDEVKFCAKHSRDIIFSGKPRVKPVIQ